RSEEREWGPRPDTSCRRDIRDTSCCRNITATSCLHPATAGSLGLDLAAAVDVTLMTNRPERIPTGVKGPLILNGQRCGALLLGRSSTTMLGLFVLTGVIDADYTGEIQIMVYTLYPPIKITKGQRIAQLVPLSQMTSRIPSFTGQTRNEKGFGSTAVTLLTVDLQNRPKQKVEITHGHQSITLYGLLDTGADTSIISPEAWPQHWPLFPSSNMLTGVGGFTLASRSPPLSVCIDNQQVSAVFSVVQLPPTVSCLIGRDILTQLGVLL
ncbi:POK9 protein, partial [Halcyon senegalensis]|nr:POK9 protein [Halcyon senegalensis]